MPSDGVSHFRVVELAVPGDGHRAPVTQGIIRTSASGIDQLEDNGVNT